MAKDNKRKVVRMNKRIQINSALIIFGIILIYVVASVILSLRKEPITTYKVNASNINNNISCDGIALRQEKEISSDKSGYVCYFVRDGDKVSKDSPVCTVDETGNLIQSVEKKDASDTKFSSSDYLEIRSAIDLFKTNYSDTNFYEVYTFRDTIDSKVMEMANQLIMKEYTAQGALVKTTVRHMTAPESGIVTYYTDGYEKLTPETLQESDFDRSKYERKALKSGEIIEAGNTIYKLNSSEAWNLCCYITIDQANTLLDENQLYYTINNSDTEMSSNYDMIRTENGYILVLPLNKYMVDYVDGRFLSVEIILDKYEGLKVPNTAIVDKQIYKIPKDYVTAGGNESGTDKVYVQSTDEEGNPTVQQVDPSIYQTDDNFYYVDPGPFSESDVLVKPDSQETLAVSKLEHTTLKGVYIANKGVADFSQVNVVKAGEEFTIVDTKDRLREFDNIVMDASQVLENQVLY